MAKRAGTLYHSGSTLTLARRSYERITSTSNEFESEIPIILSAVALEAFVNELEHMAAAAASLDGNIVSANLARVLAEAEEGKAALLLKIDVANLAMTGTLPDRGAQPYQDVRLLTALRNKLVHGKPEAVEFAEPEEEKKLLNIVTGLIGRGVIPRPTNPAIAWRQYVFVRSVAAWAHNTAVRARRWFVDLAPEKSNLKMLLEFAAKGSSEI